MSTVLLTPSNTQMHLGYHELRNMLIKFKEERQKKQASGGGGGGGGGGAAASLGVGPEDWRDGVGGVA